MLLSLLPEGISIVHISIVLGSSCLAHFSSGIKAIYCCYRNHVTMTTKAYRGLKAFEVSI